MKKLLSLMLAVLAVFGLTACGDSTTTNGDTTTNSDTTTETPKDKNYTYNTYVSLSPSNWNELTYQDNNDTEIMSYIGSNFFIYDFKYENGEIVEGDYVMKYSAATKLEDVTKTYAGDEKYAVPAEAEKAYAYEITLREDLRWDDGTYIKAEDFVYSMKEQLNPLFQNYRADSFYIGSTIIHNAQKYVKQGTTVDEITSNAYASISAAQAAGEKIQLNIDAISKIFKDSWFGGTYAQIKAAGYLEQYFEIYTTNEADERVGTGEYFFTKYNCEKGNIDLTAQMIEDYSNCDDWNPDADAELAYLTICKDYVYPEMDWSKVGMFTTGDYSFVLVLDKPLELLKEDGSLSYKAAYNMASLPLVHKGKFEANKVAPATGSTLWTSTYNSSVESTASWGPYKLTNFQSGKQFVLEKNEYWYGYNMDLYKGQYQTTKIVAETIKEWNTAWLKFQAGQIDGIGIDVTIANDYKNSDRAYFTPDDFVASLQLQSSKEALKGRETTGKNKSILAYNDFRKALSLSINRTEFAKNTTTSSLAGYGLFTSIHYYDVENGGVYRYTDPARQTLCDVYAIDTSKYANLEDAADAITGYDLTTARALVESAYAAALAAGDIKATDVISLDFGSGAVNEVVTRRFEAIKTYWVELLKGTSLEGRLEMTLSDKGDAWAEDFRAGGYDVCMGGWTGAAWDPGYFLLAYLSPQYMYSAAWDTASTMLTFTMPGVGENGADVTDTLSLLDWYDCLNGNSGCKYNWGQGALDEQHRLLLIAALEKEVLSVYYTVPLYYNFGASLISFKVDYVTYDYNTFLGYGGVRYMTYNYSDEEWAAYVASQGGNLNYK